MSTTTPNTLVISAAEIIRHAQEALFTYLPPDSGLTAEQVISKLLSILDSPEARIINAAARMQTDREVIKENARMLQSEMVKRLVDFAAHQETKAQAGEDPAATIARLRDDLARRREHETHLIEARDRLLKQNAEHAEEVIRLRAVIDHARNNLKV